MLIGLERQREDWLARRPIADLIVNTSILLPYHEMAPIIASFSIIDVPERVDYTPILARWKGQKPMRGPLAEGILFEVFPGGRQFLKDKCSPVKIV